VGCHRMNNLALVVTLPWLQQAVFATARYVLWDWVAARTGHWLADPTRHTAGLRGGRPGATESPLRWPTGVLRVTLSRK
jgi:hypothetical protein